MQVQGQHQFGPQEGEAPLDERGCRGSVCAARNLSTNRQLAVCVPGVDNAASDAKKFLVQGSHDDMLTQIPIFSPIATPEWGFAAGSS